MSTSLYCTILAAHPDPFHHEANVSNAHEISGLVNGVNGLYMAGNLERVMRGTLGGSQINGINLILLEQKKTFISFSIRQFESMACFHGT